MNIRKNGFIGYGLSALFCLCVIGAVLVAPAAAGTENVTVTKYCDNNYSAVDDSESFTLSQLRTLSSVYSNGPLYMHGPIFLDEWVDAYGTEDGYDVWDPDMQVNMPSYGYHNGTYVYELTDEVGGMDNGDEVEIFGGYGNYEYKQYFNKTNVYTPVQVGGASHYPILAWWDSEYGFAPTSWDDGIRLFFYAPPTTEGVDAGLNWSNTYMRDSLPEYYWHNYTKHGYNLPSAKGNSVKEVHTVNIYPAHRYDFATGGDTVESAYKGEVGATPAVNEPSGAVTTSNIATVDNVFETSSASDGKFAAQRFVFDLSEDAANIEKLAFTWTGTGSHESGDPADQGATTYIWKNNVGYMPLSSVTTGISDYVVNGDVTVLVKQNAASSGGDASSLSTDYVKLVVTHHHSN